MSRNIKKYETEAKHEGQITTFEDIWQLFLDCFLAFLQDIIHLQRKIVCLLLSL